MTQHKDPVSVSMFDGRVCVGGRAGGWKATIMESPSSDAYLHKTLPQAQSNAVESPKARGVGWGTPASQRCRVCRI